MKGSVAFTLLAVNALAGAGTVLWPQTAAANENLTHHGAFRDWQVFRLDRTNLKACYAATEASRYHPRAPARRQPILYIVRYREATTVNTVEIRFGSDVARLESVTAKLIARRKQPRDSFALTIKKNAGFIAKPSTQKMLIQAMQKGRELVVVSKPGEPEILEDRYSMYGFTKALRKLEDICPGPNPVTPAGAQTGPAEAPLAPPDAPAQRTTPKEVTP